MSLSMSHDKTGENKSHCHCKFASPTELNIFLIKRSMLPKKIRSISPVVPALERSSGGFVPGIHFSPVDPSVRSSS